MSLIDNIYNTLRRKILKYEIPAGTKLSENSLAKEFTCSRMPVREALKRLERDGFIVVKPSSGSFVSEPTLKEFIEQTELRAYLEALAFRLVCEKKADIKELEKILYRMDECLREKQIDMLAFGDLHYDFHRKIVDLAENDLLSSIYAKMNLNTASQMFYESVKKRRDLKTIQVQHWRIVNMIESCNERQGERYIMEHHLWKKREILRQQLADKRE